MATIEIARRAGACFGVERALKRVQDLMAADGGPVHTLGPLIHNPAVVADLDAHGVDSVDGVPDREATAGETLVVRSHGVVPQVVDDARARGFEVVDATCPYVKKVHHGAEKLAAEGYDVLVVGEAGHPEVEGILGHAPGARVVPDAETLEGLELGRRVGIVVQTTQSKDTLDAVVEAVLGRADEVRVLNTICAATSERQSAAAELSSRADVMVVIGGKNSANTTRLATICAAHCPTHHVESPDELQGEWFQGAELVGITAGASTPQAQIDGLVGAVEALMDGGGDR